MSSNISKGNFGGAVIDAICLVADITAVAIAFVPGGVGTVTNIARDVDAAVDYTKTAETAAAETRNAVDVVRITSKSV